MNRRGFLTGLGAALFTAPAIVRASSLMPVKVVDLFPLRPETPPPWLTVDYLDAILHYMKEANIPDGACDASPFINGVARVPAGSRFMGVEVTISRGIPNDGVLLLGHRP